MRLNLLPLAVKAQASLAFARLTAAFSFPISPFTFHCPAPTVTPLALCFSCTLRPFTPFPLGEGLGEALFLYPVPFHTPSL